MRVLSTRTVSVTTTPTNIRKTPSFANDPAAYPVAFSTLRYPSGGGSVQLYPSEAFTATLTIGTPANNETYVLNGVTITFVTTATTGSVTIGATPTITAANLVAFLSASSAVALQQATYSSAAAVVTITFTGMTGGTPSGYTLGTNSAGVTRSGATLAAGTSYGTGLSVDPAADFNDIDQALQRWAISSAGTVSLSCTDAQY